MDLPKEPVSRQNRGPLSAELPIPIDLRRTAAVPLHLQLAAQVRAGVLSGALPDGARLPGTRALAAALSVTRGVVTDAYGALIADGTLESAVGSGTRVPTGAAQTQAEAPRTPAWFSPLEAAPVDQAHWLRGIHFKTGVTTGATLNLGAWRRAWAAAAREGVTGDYGDVTGEPDLRAALAAFVGRARGLPARPEEVLVTAGTLQALNLIARGVLPRGSVVYVENPGYMAARQVFLDAGHVVRPLPVDEDGPQVDALNAGGGPARLVYVTPSHQFPLGVRMNLPRRLALLAWAQQHDALIVEDDYDGEFRYGAPPLPPLASLDRSGRVLYLGTLSKVLTPAVRTGFVLARGALHGALVRERTLLDGGHPLPVQRALTELLTRGEVDRHVRRTRRWHAQVREALAAPLLPLKPRAVLGGIEAGLHACLHLAPGLDAQEVARRLERREVFVSTLAPFTFAGAAPNALLLGYGALNATQARAGARVIAQVIGTAPAAALRETPPRPGS